jgi:uncharacterized protein
MVSNVAAGMTTTHDWKSHEGTPWSLLQRAHDWLLQKWILSSRTRRQRQPLGSRLVSSHPFSHILIVPATLTDPFLDFTASRGNDLRSIGLTAGCKWCLCAGRWKEALEHASKQESAPEGLVPKVHLHATHQKALDVVDIKDLKNHAAEPPVYNASTVPQSSDRDMGSAIKQTTELAGKGDMTGRE